jgi:predicted GIY-YIG superfamily endonuclease
MKGTIYLLHFNRPYKHAAHYIGYTRDLSARLESHANGTGARLVEVITQAGITFQLARTWQGTRKTERSLKNRGGAKRICPLCNPQAMNRALKCA